MVDLEPRESSRSDEGATPGSRRGRRGTREDEAPSSSAGLVALALVVLALLGSVIIPARQALSITRLLRETTEVLAPARLLVAHLQSGLAEELGAHQSHVLTGDSALLARFDTAAAENDRQLAALEKLAPRLDTSAVAQIAVVRRRVDEWRRSSRTLPLPDDTRTTFVAAERAAEARHESALEAVGRLADVLAAGASLRDSRVRELERLSVTANAALVLAALAALSAVMVLTLRERRLASSLRRRVEEESARARQASALRGAAESLAGANTVDEVTNEIARAALEVLEGHGAFVERITMRSGDAPAILTVDAAVGTAVPPLGSSRDVSGSNAEQILSDGAPVVIGGMSDARGEGPRRSDDISGDSSIAVPLATSVAPVGVLFVLGVPTRVHRDAVARAAILGQLGALAYERVRLLDEAIEGRRRLERVIASRSRLMRGFSHDVKNPIGAADGFAALLDDGVYGELAPAQRESIARIRRCMHDAISLVDDLHELARAETGHLELSPEPLDVAALVGRIAEEWQGTADARGLSFTATVEADVPIIRTSIRRVHQILGNLVSNAIKYTDGGSVTVRATRRLVGPSGDDGDWIAIAIADTGRGIEADKLDFIFEEFGRIGDSGKTGAGLGLAISRLLATALGGHITVVSAPGHGSTFTLWLPASA